MGNKLLDLQKAEKEILKATLWIIQKYNLRYFLLGGTLLGAVRHQGFIPWDDDIDIGLPRPDYDRFLEVAEAELQEPFYLRTFQNGKRPSGVYFTQVANKNVQLKRVNAGHETIDNAWIDIFPLDGVPDGKLDFFMWKNKAMLLSKLFTLSQVEKIYDVKLAPEFKTVKEKTIYWLLKLKLQKVLNPTFFWNALDHELKKHDYNKTMRLINFCGNWRMKEMFDKKVYGEGSLYHFEDMMLMGPADYDFVLTQMYGDYMTLPPEEKRNHHNTIVM